VVNPVAIGEDADGVIVVASRKSVVSSRLNSDLKWQGPLA
jgi:hypothetical protein